jgi:hypothetical protein
MCYWKAVVIGAALIVLAAACGDAGEVEDAAELPPAADACLAGDPDCGDLGPLPTGDEEPPLLPGEPDDGADPGVVTPLVGGGLSVADVVGTAIDGGFAIVGFYVDDGSGPLLCDALAESFPPQCGGERIPFDDSAGVVDPDDLESSGGVTWSNLPIVVVGEVVDGTFVATPIGG